MGEDNKNEGQEPKSPALVTATQGHVPDASAVVPNSPGFALKSDRIRFQDADVEAGEGGPSARPNLRRHRSSISIHSIHSAVSVNTVDPSTALPIQYRTL
jgi:hypothetical protein